MPGSPVQSAITPTTWAATWAAGTAGVPEQTFKLKCISRADLADPVPACGGIDGSGYYSTEVSFATPSAVISSLTPSSHYDCWVVAVNVVNGPGGTCSSAHTTITTPG